MRRTILCIDDDERALYIRTKILELLDYRVLIAKSAAEGLRMFSREGPDVVVLDYYMPDMNGAQVAWELKRRGSVTPILMLSSAVFCPDDAADVVDAFCAKIDGPVHFLETLNLFVAEKPEQHTVLHVNAHETQRSTAARALRRAGFKVLEACNGGEALESVGVQPDVILLDLQLPDIDGHELCRRLKADPASAHIPILHLAPDLPAEELVSTVHAEIQRRAES